MPATCVVGVPVLVEVQIVDENFRFAAYTGTITWQLTDGGMGSVTMTNESAKDFDVVFSAPGTQTITVSEAIYSLSAVSGPIDVTSPGAPRWQLKTRRRSTSALPSGSK